MSENAKSGVFFEIWGICMGHLGSHKSDKLDLHNNIFVQFSKSLYNSHRYPPSFQAPLGYEFAVDCNVG